MILSLCPNPSIDTLARLEFLTPGQVNRLEDLREYPGGKGVHVALALAELGEESRLFGNWAGAAGRWIQRECESRGVAVTGISLAGNNRKCYALRSSQAGHDNTELLEPGPAMGPGDWEDFKINFKKEAEEASLICMSGSWPRQAPPDAYKQAIEVANSVNARVMLDCSGDQLKAALKTSFFGLHLNEQEALELCGSSRPETVLEALNGRVQLLALTRGKDGLSLCYQGKTVHANVQIENIKSTVGSGDCLTAGIAHAVARNLSLRQIAAYGVACGAANCLTEELGMLHRPLVEQLLPRVTFNPIENET